MRELIRTEPVGLLIQIAARTVIHVFKDACKAVLLSKHFVQGHFAGSNDASLLVESGSNAVPKGPEMTRFCACDPNAEVEKRVSDLLGPVVRDRFLFRQILFENAIDEIPLILNLAPCR